MPNSVVRYQHLISIRSNINVKSGSVGSSLKPVSCVTLLKVATIVSYVYEHERCMIITPHLRLQFSSYSLINISQAGRAGRTNVQHNNGDVRDFTAT